MPVPPNEQTRRIGEALSEGPRWQRSYRRGTYAPVGSVQPFMVHAPWLGYCSETEGRHECPRSQRFPGSGLRSRRLGVSLGVNMMPATGKICTFDCLYCENGLNEQRQVRQAATLATRALEAKLRQMRDEASCPTSPSPATASRPPRRSSPRRSAQPSPARRARPDRQDRKPSQRDDGLAPEVHDALMLVDDNILKLDTADVNRTRLLDRPVGPP